QVSSLYTYQGHKAGVYALSWCSDGSRIASVDASGLARIWQAVSRGNTPQGKFLESRQISPVLDSQGHGSETALLWSPGANQIAFGSYPGEIHIWDITHNKDLVIRDYQTLGASLAWSPDNTRLAAVYIGSDMVRVAFWDLTTTNLLVDMELTSNTKLVGTFSSFTTPVALAWSSNGKRIALSIKDSLSQVNETHIWEVTSKRALARLPIGSYDLAWSPDAEYLATDNQVWDAESGRLERTYPTNGNTVAWSPNGEYLATGGKDNSISVWEASTGKLLRIYQGHTRPINMVRWSPDSSFLASASEDRTVRIFPGD
ncbi:MAG TPA: hypothetical protein VFN35_05190, partial [Ktedonobacteraceae bacterium]|nr:hypothetical protein [Ktedonobacteraceae bacterium]